MSLSNFLLSGLLGAGVGTVAITTKQLEPVPGVAVGVVVFSVVYIVIFLAQSCTQSRPQKEKSSQKAGSSAEPNQPQLDAPEKAKKKKKKKPASKKKPADVVEKSPPQKEAEEEDEEEEKKLSKTQLRRQRIKKKKESAEQAAEVAKAKAEEEAKLKKVQEKLAKEAAKIAAQQREAENKLKKQFKAASAEGGWETQKVKEKKAPAVKPLDAPRDLKESSGPAPTVERFKATVNVPKNLLGAVIGIGGVNIQAITAKTGARITTPKEDNPGPVIIEGVDERGVNAAKNAIESIMKTGVSNITHPGSTSNKVQLTDSKEIGIIIGPGGVNVKKLQKDLNVAIKMPEKDGKLVVTVSGAKEQVKTAKEAIEDLIHLGYSKVTHPDFTSLEVSYPSGSFGKLIGPRGQNIKSIQGNTKCRVNIPKPGNPRYKPDTVIIVGPAGKLESAKKQVLNTLVEREYVEDFGDPNDPNYEEPEDDY